MDAPLEAMVYPVKVILLFFCAWVLSFPVLLWSFSRSPLSKVRLSLLKSYLLHLVSLPVLFVWAFFVCEPTTNLSLATGLVVFVPISLYCPFILSWLLKARLLAGLTMGIAGGLFAAVMLLLITWIWPYPRSPAIVSAQEDMWRLGTALFDHTQFTKSREEEGRFPIPEDGEGHPIAGSLPENATEAESTPATGKRLLYYRGPSFVPVALATMEIMRSIPTDPFDEEGERPYGYGVGPLQGPGAAFLLSCYGPDGISQAEELEHLLLEKYRARAKAFFNVPEAMPLTYSPTNGTVSPGDLYRADGW